MPLQLPPDEARRFLERHEAPAPHLDLLHAMAWRAAAAGVRLGVFDALAAGPLTAGDVAGKLAADERGVTVLLDALVEFGYLEVTEGGYANGPVADTWLRHDLPGGGYTTAMRFWDALLSELWPGLESSVRDGRPARDFYAWLDQHPDRSREFQGMLGGMAAGIAGEVAATVPLPEGATRLLDLGGGHGRYSVAFCRRYPGLRATILDVPGALAAGRDVVAAEGLSGRVTLRPGDLLDGDLLGGDLLGGDPLGGDPLGGDPLGGDPLGGGRGGYDVALLFNILHGYTTEQNRTLLGRVAGAVRPGGLLVLLEPLPDVPEGAGRADAAFVRGFSLNLFHTQGGQVYGFDDYARWLAGAGFSAPRRYPLEGSATDWLLVATRTT